MMTTDQARCQYLLSDGALPAAARFVRPALVPLLVVFLFCAFQQRLAAEDLEIVVRKESEESRPTLVLGTCSGHPKLRQTLARVIDYSGWFRVVGEGASDYKLNAIYREGASAPLQLTVRSRDGGGFRARLGRAGATMPNQCREAVDRLIQNVFGQPGPCLSRIAFVRGEGRKEIALLYPDGTGYQLLTRNGAISTEPAWGGTPGNLVYTLYRNHRNETVWADTRNKRQRRLSRQSGLSAGAAPSPDGQQLAVCLSRGGRVDLYLRRLADGQLTRLTNDRAVEASPAWAPDGRALCYVSDRGGRPQVHYADLANGRHRRLLSESFETVSPDWSPDGRQVCMAVRRGGRYRIGVVEVKGGHPGTLELVTDAKFDWESPAWGPDGRHLVCTRERGTSRAICLVDTRSARVTPLTRAGTYALPDWSPGLAPASVSGAEPWRR